MNTVRINKENVKMIAHRGLSGLEPENTAVAFLAAANRSYFGIETDVHKTSDGKYILTHDDTTGRVADKNLTVEETDFETLRSLKIRDAAFKGVCFPTPEEYVSILKKYSKVGVLEFKNAFKKEDIKEVLETVKKQNMLSQMIFISFCYQNLLYIKELEPTAKIQFLCCQTIDDELCDRLAADGFGIDTEYSQLSAFIVNLLHSKGVEINCWTCNDKKAAEKLVSWGVDYITSNILE